MTKIDQKNNKINLLGIGGMYLVFGSSLFSVGSLFAGASAKTTVDFENDRVPLIGTMENTDRG